MRTSLLLAALIAGCSGDDASAPDAGGAADAGGRDAGGGADAGGPDAGVMPRVEWPNEESRATSDPWIRDNHDRIDVMRPRVLALNFVNARTNEEMVAF